MSTAPVNTAGVPLSQAPGSPVPQGGAQGTLLPDYNGINPTPAQLAARVAAAGAPTAPVAPPATPPVEPTVVSGSTITNDVIPANNTKLDSLASKGTYVGSDGNLYYSDQTLVPAPVGAEYDPATGGWSSAGKTYGAAPQYVTGDDPESQQTNTLFASMKMSLDSQTLSQVNNIQSQYDTLRQQQQDANARADSTRTRSLLVGGGSRYAPLASAGITLAQTSFGLRQIQMLDDQENSAIAQAKQAQASGDMELMDKALTTVDETRQAKQTAAQKVSDQLATANADALAHSQAAANDEAIAQVMASGVTDPTAALSTLAKAGVNVTADDVARVFKDLTPASSATDTFKFSNENVGKLLGSGVSASDIQKLQDYYNGKADSSTLSGLSGTQTSLLHNILNGTSTAGSSSGSAKTITSGTLKYTADDLEEGRNKLDQSKGPDGYVDPNVYLDMANAWTSQGGSIKDYIKNFPISSWINPANTFVTPAINALITQDAAATKTTGTSSGRSL